MTTDDFTAAARAEAERRFEFVSDMACFEEGTGWARTRLAAQGSAALSALRAAVDGPHPANSVLDAYTLAYVSARLDEVRAAHSDLTLESEAVTVESEAVTVESDEPEVAYFDDERDEWTL